MDTELQNLINRFKDFPVIEHKPSFLEIAGFPSRETVWRNIFAFFFDPNECHGLKDLFLRAFFDALGKPEQGTGDFDSMTVRKERQTEKGNYLDLLIQCHEFSLGIEMKVNAGLYNDLADYGKLVKARSTLYEHKVVLSSAPCKTHSGFVNLRYIDLVPAIKQQLGNYLLAADPKYISFLLDFLNHVTCYIGGYTMNIDPKQLQFLKDNHETVKRLVSTHSEARNLLERRMEQIHDSIIASDSLKGVITQKWRLFSWHGHQLTKFFVVAGKIRFFYQLCITDDYCNATGYWIDPAQREYQNLNHELKAAGFGTEKFELSQSLDEVVAAVEKTLLRIIEFLNHKQTVATA